MNYFMKKINIYLFYIISLVILIAIIVLLIIYFKVFSTEKITGLIGGLSTGLIVGWLQFFLRWTEHKEMVKVKQLGINRILPSRDDKELYRNVIINSKERIWVLGNTAYRFILDFADESGQGKKDLIDALNRNVEVRFLLPQNEFLWKPDDKKLAEISHKEIQKLYEKFPKLIECKLYNHSPFHSMVLVDYDCFVGPIFPNIPSRNTPTIYTDVKRTFAKSYYDYFQYEWGLAIPCQ